MHFVPFVVSVLLAMLPLAAQTVVSPRHNAAAEGNQFGFHGPASNSTPARYLMVHGELQGGPLVIQSCSFRRDGNGNNTGIIPGFSIVCDVFLSTAATTPAQPSATFDQNHGLDRQQVNAFRVVQFPESTPGAMPRPFDFTIPFNQPYAHGGQGALCFELKVVSRTNAGGIPLDYCSGGSASPAPFTRSFGEGCRHLPTGTPLALSPSATASWSGIQGTATLSLSGSNAKPNAITYITIGASSTAFGAIPLPFALPGTESGLSGRCHVYNDVLLAVPAIASGSGTVTAGFTLGVNPTYNGLSLFAQLIAPDLAANNWGLVTSNGTEFHLVAPHATPPVGEVYSDGSSGPVGSVRANAGYVMKFN